MAQVIWSGSALEEIALIRYYIAQFDPTAANRLANKLQDAGDRLENFPRRGRALGGGVRQLSLIWPYVIPYEIVGDEVHILRVRHGARRNTPPS